MQTQIFPSNWKKALILPINKSTNPTAPEHYRLILILYVISKLFEKTISRHIMNFLTIHGILDPFQSGFQKGLSDICMASEDNQISMLVLFDFSKAFDRVSHKIMLSKLRLCGYSLEACYFIKSYFEGREISGSSEYQGSYVLVASRTKWCSSRLCIRSPIISPFH